MPPELLGLPCSRPLTADDLDLMPDDGHRYELIDGVLLVTPSPRHVHQRGVGNLYLVMRAEVPDDLEVVLAPFDVRLAAGQAFGSEALVPDAPFPVRVVPQELVER